MSDAVATRPALAVCGLACRRGERVLFDGLDLAIAPGEAVWLRAANGYGKTTLLRTIVGLARPERGTIAWSGGGRRLYVAHANALKDDLTVAESVRHACDLAGVASAAADVDEALARVGLLARRRAPVRTLSQGQRRRVALARLPLSSPADAWVLDEPFDALDGDGVACVASLIAAHVAAGGLALFTSHVAPGALADRARTVALDASPP